MRYFNATYYDSLKHSDMAKKRDLDGTSISKEKGTDGKANNTSAYNHDYYIHHKEKWQDNKDSKNGSSTSANGGDDKSGLKDGEFDLDAAALDVIRGKYGNGQARKDALGADYEMVQRRVNEMYKEGRFGNGSTSKVSTTENKTESKETSSERSTKWYKNYDNRIKDTKAQKAEKAAQEKAAKEAQEQAAKEAAQKAAKKKKK